MLSRSGYQDTSALNLECVHPISVCVVSGVRDNSETGGRVLPCKNVVSSLCQLSIPAAFLCHLLLVRLCFVRQFIMGF